ncbi:acyltransferase [Pedococcus sp. NPDC057267]|uniref:acyltransferase n=1 Tax=Pedococcus sp. NPDC057267 TaxID=3346077 RepID=UPI00362FC6E0
MTPHLPLRHGLLYVANTISGLLPQTRFFRLRNALYRSAGGHIEPGVRISGTARIPHPNVSIGAETWVGAGCELISTEDCGIAVGTRCDLGPGVMLVAGSHEIGNHYRRGSDRGNSSPVTVGAGSWVGARSVLLAGTIVGAGSVVAAGAVVRGQHPPDSLLAGVPATVVRRLPH